MTRSTGPAALHGPATVPVRGSGSPLARRQRRVPSPAATAEMRESALWSDLPTEPGAAEALADALRSRGLVEPGEVEVADGLVWILFAESDFVVRVERAVSRPGTRVSISAAVRSPEPSLETWWSEWTLSCTCGDLATDVHADVVRTRRRYLQMLAERFVDESA